VGSTTPWPRTQIHTNAKHLLQSRPARLFKYADFFIETSNHLLATDFNVLNIILPLAISFFTFQQIAYLVDRYQDHDNQRRITFREYALFVVFFPQLIAGPIVHHSHVLPQFRQPGFGRFSLDNFSIGLTIFFFGLFKKVYIGDQFGEWASPAFDAVDGGEMLASRDAWYGALSYTFQLYFDFSGYSDMAIGLARLFGVVLPANFFSPYKADSIIEFWRRWHMTLSQFLRDYLYIPLGGSRKGTSRRYTNLMITMLIGGLWHGAGWTFVFWGALHGMYLCANHGWRALTSRWTISLPPLLAKPLAVGLTFFAVVIAWVFFRAETFTGALLMLQSMFDLAGGSDGRIVQLYDDAPEILRWIGYACIIVWLTPNVLQLFADFKPTVDVLPDYSGKIRWTPNIVWFAVLLLVMITSIQSLSNISEFLYFRF
jgi:alginate O-acetyltransferase complex protein AlgI